MKILVKHKKMIPYDYDEFNTMTNCYLEEKDSVMFDIYMNLNPHTKKRYFIITADTLLNLSHICQLGVNVHNIDFYNNLTIKSGNTAVSVDDIHSKDLNKDNCGYLILVKRNKIKWDEKKSKLIINDLGEGDIILNELPFIPSDEKRIIELRHEYKDDEYNYFENRYLPKYDYYNKIEKTAKQ